MSVGIETRALYEAPHVLWTHIDGPLMTWAAGMHWLTRRERIRIWLNLASVEDIACEVWPARRSYVGKTAPPDRPLDPRLLFDAMKIAQQGFATWAAKPHNRGWARKIDGTPIPNDLPIVIAEAFVEALASAPSPLPLGERS